MGGVLPRPSRRGQEDIFTITLQLTGNILVKYIRVCALYELKLIFNVMLDER